MNSELFKMLRTYDRFFKQTFYLGWNETILAAIAYFTLHWFAFVGDEIY